MRERVVVDGVELQLVPPDELDWEWIGRRELVDQLLACWMKLADDDLPLNPRLVGPPGVGKTTLACAAARRLGREVWIFQATADTRPEDLVIAPVLDEGGRVRYVASPIVSAMIRGGVVVLDEGNRMTERAWASLAPLLDHRRSVDSALAGVRIRAHDDFRFCTTMNDDASTYDLPEYISSRLAPRIVVDWPEAEEELRILAGRLPFAPEELLRQVVAFLQEAHRRDEPFTVRDGINLARYALKRAVQAGEDLDAAIAFLPEAARAVLGEEEDEPAGGDDPGRP